METCGSWKVKSDTTTSLVGISLCDFWNAIRITFKNYTRTVNQRINGKNAGLFNNVSPRPTKIGLLHNLKLREFFGQIRQKS